MKTIHPVLVACRASSFAYLRFGYPARLGLNSATWSDVPRAERVIKMGVTKEGSKNVVLQVEGDNHWLG